ncbi:phage major capsid protein [Salininema proteolyticum]|uniref:Phage major capsid protein n=1 Tax=Salininema proteolyticum TaxID=1607685 RepID=A0ABV8TSY2_9ACTN
MPTIRELQQERAKLHAEAKAIMDEVDAGRDMTPDEEQTYDRLMDDADRKSAAIGRAERLREAERLDGDRADSDEQSDRAVRPEAGSSEVDAFRAYLVGGMRSLDERQSRALNMGSDPEGGYLVAPQQFSTSLIQAVDDAVPLRGLATTMQLTQGESLGVPTLDTDLNDADWTSEVATGSLDDALRVGKREFRTNPLAKRVKISRTLLRRAAVDPEALVRDRLAYKFAVTQEKAFMTGDGNKKPLGLFTASNDGVPTSRDVDINSTGGVLDSNSTSAGGAADDLITAKHTLKSQYWPNASWLFHRDLLAQIRKLRDANGQYLWQPGLTADRPDTILEVPYVASEYVPNTVANDSYVGMIGDFSHYWIADSLALEVQRLVELYAEANQVGFIGRLETDGAPILAEAFVRLQINE